MRTAIQASPQRAKRGVALVIVISLIAMLTVVTVALLLIVGQSTQRTAGEVAAHQSEALSEMAFNVLLADLGDEIERGSSGKIEETLANGKKYRRYDISARRMGMVVTESLRTGLTSATPLVKQSQPDVSFHTWGPALTQRASSISTAAAGAGRFDPRMWSSPRLLVSTFSFTAATAPTWVYVVRNGSNPKIFTASPNLDQMPDRSPNPGFVIGRYAYNLYQTSGLLDINVAGSPMSNGPSALRRGLKGGLAFADLTRLPGMTQAGVDSLTTWRHSWKSDPANPSATIDSTADDYLRQSEGTGWRKMIANDNVFLNRQDLLAFADTYPAALPREALPLVTHFTRDLDAPSYRPDIARTRVAANAASGGNDGYNFDLETTAREKMINPDITSFDTVRKRQLLPRRFPLERLKYVATPSGANVTPEVAAKALAYFGLVWKGTYWEYVHARSNGDIYTLQEVPVTREANFFETLRSTVLAGSLGRQFAAVGHDDLDQRLSMHRLGGVDGSINLNIMEMGAAIIDQSDPDGNPTAIQFPGPLRTYFVFGKEDVPYLQRLSAIPYRGKPLALPVYYRTDSGAAGPQAPTEAYEVNMVLQPMLWRPHQIAPNPQAPTKFRIRPEHTDPGGGSLFFMTAGWPVPNNGSQPNFVPPRTEQGNYSYWGGPNYRLTNPELFPKTFKGNEYLEITVPPDSPAFREPQSVHSKLHAGIAGYTISGNVDPIETRSGDLRWNGLPNSYTEVSGFLVGKAITARTEATNAPAGMNNDLPGYRMCFGFFRGDTPLEVQMEYQAPDGNWRPYQRAEFTYKSNYGHHYIFRDPRWQTEAYYWSSHLIDPRTARFGGIANVCSGGLLNPLWGLHGQMNWPEGASLSFSQERNGGVRTGWSWPSLNTGWNFAPPAGQGTWNNKTNGHNPGSVAENNVVGWNEPMSFAYKDPDKILRNGIASFNETNQWGNPMNRRYTISPTGLLSTSSAPMSGRPVVLNRPFCTVGDLGYAFRGTPWRDIDFVNPNSPDSGLLDVFSVYDVAGEAESTAPITGAESRVVAGRVNINSAPPDVIAALLSGASREDGNVSTTALSNVEASSYANILVGNLRSKAATLGPLLSKAELISRPTGETIRNQATGENEPEAISQIRLISNSFSLPAEKSIKSRREAITRALSDGTTVRPWTFMLDLVVQSGRLARTATSLENFSPLAERRYWVHFSIDRISGELIDVQWERASN